MNLLSFEYRPSAEENAVSALLRLEGETENVLRYWSIGVGCALWPTWFFMLKLIYELERIPSERVSVSHEHGTSSLQCARQAKDLLWRMRKSLDFKTNGPLFADFESTLGALRDKMQRLIREYPYKTDPIRTNPKVERALLA